MNRDRLDAHFMARAMDPQRDFAAVGDQQLLDLHQPMITRGWSNSTGWPSLMSTFFTVPPSGAVIGFMTFIASTISSVSPAFTGFPTSMKTLPPGSGER